MMKFWAFLILIYYLFNNCHCGTLPSGQQTEQTLINSLLNGYNKNIRPDDQVSVDITAAIQQIVSLDDKQQIMTSSSFISQTWFDERLSWTPNSSNDNIEVVMLPVKSLWIPDTLILNSADGNGYLTVSDYSLASVAYTGQVYMILPALTIKTRCNLLVQKFPFDRQVCSINLTSWGQGYNRIIYTEENNLVVDIRGYTEHPLWKLTGTDMIIILSEDRAPFEETYNAVISIQLFLQRKPLFFIMNGIFACLVLNCGTLLAYSLSFSTQVSLCMICFMTYSVYSLNFANLFPQQSQYIMMITLFFLLSISWTLVSLAWFVICNHYMTKNEMPKRLFKFCGQLQKIFCCCFPSTKSVNDQDQKKDIIIETGHFRKTDNQQAIEIKDIQKTTCSCCKRLFAGCLSKRTHSVEERESTKYDSPGVELVETPADVSRNEREKPTCNFCNRCEKCQTDFDKDKDKDKKKKEIEAKCNALNYLVFLCVLILMFASNLAVWLVMSG